MNDKTKVSGAVTDTIAEAADQFVMPTKSVALVYHFKKISKAKKPDEFAILEQAAAAYPHVTVELAEVKKEGTEEVTDVTIKRVSETHNVLVPDYAALLASIGLDDEGNCIIQGTTAKEFSKVQEAVESYVETYGRSLVDGSAEQNDEGEYIKREDGSYILTGFSPLTVENCTFAIVAAIEKARAGAGGKDTISAELRDAGALSICEYLTSVGVPAAGLELYGKLVKSYYSRNVAAALQVDAIKRTAERLAAWYAQLDEDDKLKFGPFHTRLQAKALDVTTPKTVEMGIL